MKHLSIFTILAIMFAACGTSTASGNSSSATAQNSDFTFLKKLGIDVDSIKKLDKELNLEIDDEFLPFIMTDAQMRALLEFDINGEEEIEGNYAITGIRALPNNHTLILYNVEYGDGASKLFAIYDSNGKTTDYLDTGYWNEVRTNESNDDYTHGTAYGDKTTCSFDAPSKMVLSRKNMSFEWTSPKDAYEHNLVKEFWSINKKYEYTITNEGLFVLDNITTKNVGPVDAEIAMLEEISDLSRVPNTDNSIFDKVNKLALRDDIRKLIPNEDSQVGYRLMNIVQNLFNTQPQRLLLWMSQHRDMNRNAITGLFESCFSSSWIPKESLIEEINKIPNGNAKKYIEELTAQWGPADAVG